MFLRPEYLFDYPIITVGIAVIVFCFGACIGSFLNVVIFRIPKGESLVKSNSHCMTCGEPIKWYDLFPIFSWLALRGKCRGCGEKISRRYPLVESLTGLVFVATLFKFSLSWAFIITAVFFSVIIATAFMDWDTQEMDVPILLIGGILSVPAYFLTDIATLKERLIGAVIVSIPFLIIALITKGIGMGDVILMACAGAYLGYKGIVVAAFFGIIIAAVVGIIIKKVKKQSKFAFGPWLCIGIFFGTLFGNQLFDMYASLLRV